MGGDHPIRIQSMTTVDTMDTAGSVAQTIRMVEAGCEYVRITAPSIKEAKNLEEIKKELRKRGYSVPLIADIHFTPNAAELAARIVEKVRINPGNYADKKRFEQIDYSESAYQEELERIRKKFTPLVLICKEHGTAMRIGTNHGSLSDRIMSRYGDTPLGMVESALEFLRICEDLHYYDIVLSMKASNPQVMIQAYRLLVLKLDEEEFQPYPLHLGVTEAGDGEDGRIKSSVGIGTLLEDGLGDTIRVSLTEEPEAEVPIAKALADRYKTRKGEPIPEITTYPIHPFEYTRRLSHEGIEVMTNADATSVERSDTGIEMTVSRGNAGEAKVRGSILLVCAGRQPTVNTLELDRAGVKASDHGVEVNEYLQTSNAHIYAAGDVAGPFLFTHMADAQARVVVRNILMPFQVLRQKIDYSVVPWCTYVDPEIATVGLTESAAAKKNVPCDVIVQKLEEVDRAVLESEDYGFAKVVVKKGTDQILGATLVCENAGELLHEFVLAMKYGIGLSKIAATIHAYPTLSELARKMGDKYNRTRLTPSAKKVFNWLYQRQLH